ncbi:hypothetical protein ACFL1G_02935 [Planctomycetota bacterium]
MSGKKSVAVILFAIFFIVLLFWLTYFIYSSMMSSLRLLLLGIFGCITISYTFYAFSKKVNGRIFYLILTFLLSIWIGGHFFTFGILSAPSMGMVGVPVGIFLFSLIWASYALISWFIVPLMLRIVNRKKEKQLEKIPEADRGIWAFNKWQTRVLCTGLFLLFLTILMLPISYTPYSKRTVYAIGFLGLVSSNEVEYNILFIEWLIILAVTSVGILLLRKRKKTPLK